MLGVSLAMLLGGVLLMLRISQGGSFPSPLSAEEEKNIWRCGKAAILRREMCWSNTICGSLRT